MTKPVTSTEERLAQIHARADAATKGVRLVMDAEEEAWRLVAPDPTVAGQEDVDDDYQHVASFFDGNSKNAGPDCVFCAHAYDDIPWLLDQLRPAPQLNQAKLREVAEMAQHPERDAYDQYHDWHERLRTKAVEALSSIAATPGEAKKPKLFIDTLPPEDRERLMRMSRGENITQADGKFLSDLIDGLIARIERVTLASSPAATPVVTKLGTIEGDLRDAGIPFEQTTKEPK